MCTMNHDTEREPHDAGRDVGCKFESQLGNKVYLCKVCVCLGRGNPVTGNSCLTSCFQSSGQGWGGDIL